MIFGHGAVHELRKIKELLELYCKAIGMAINMNKYIVLLNGLSEEIKNQLALLFPMTISDLDLEFSVPSGYQKKMINFVGLKTLLHGTMLLS